MKPAIIRKNGIISAEQTLKYVKERFPFFRDEGDLYSALIRISKHHYGTRKTALTEQEMKLYDVLLAENLCPDTVYKYLQTYMVKDEVKQRYILGKLSKEQLQKMGLNEIRRIRVQRLLSVVEEGRKLFEDLREV